MPQRSSGACKSATWTKVLPNGRPKALYDQHYRAPAANAYVDLGIDRPNNRHNAHGRNIEDVDENDLLAAAIIRRVVSLR
jgi:hypothetical protein